jgi:anti-sigma regulatory factor (Ser/Thr protein kinase)
MEVALKVRLPADKKAPGLARRALDALNGELEGVREPVRLLVSEVVTNSVRHAGLTHADKIELEVAAEPSAVRVEVVDPGPGFEAAVERSPNAEGGFGLFFVDELADRWGTDGARVWFELDRA